ncbi:MAG: PLP-dependent aminotransferase family protein [Candidatus Bipolaricaulota bacterium]
MAIKSVENFYSEKAKDMVASEVKDLLEAAKSEDIISLAGGLPHPRTFPSDLVKNISCKILEEKGAETLQYGTTMGFKGLREEIAKRYRNKFNTDIEPDSIMITAGSQQGLFLIGRAFLESGDDLVVEAPTYLAALTAFENFSPNYIEVPLDEDGMKIDILKQKLENGINPKFVYTVPTFQNPAGVTMEEENRRRLMELSRKYDFLVIEDGPYNELRYKGERINPIISYDNEKRTIFLGTFSKILAPGFRLGWIMGDRRFLEKLEVIKQSLDICSNVFSQHIAYEYMKTGKIDEQIKKIIRFYEPKQQVLLESLEDYMPDNVDWTTPEGGMFSWVTLPENIDAKAMLNEALEEGVAYVSGHAFYATSPVKNSLRLNFTFVEEEEIREGVRKLAKVVENRLAS